MTGPVPSAWRDDGRYGADRALAQRLLNRSSDRRLRQGPANGNFRRFGRSVGRSLCGRLLAGDGQVPIKGLSGQINIAGTRHHSICRLHIEHLAPDVTGCDPAIGIQCIVRGRLIAVPAIGFQGCGCRNKPADIDWNCAAPRLHLKGAG